MERQHEQLLETGGGTACWKLLRRGLGPRTQNFGEESEIGLEEMREGKSVCLEKVKVKEK